jgi:hypothetical protein
VERDKLHSYQSPRRRPSQKLRQGRSAMMEGEAQAPTRSDDYRRRTPFVSSLVLQSQIIHNLNHPSAHRLCPRPVSSHRERVSFTKQPLSTSINSCSFSHATFPFRSLSAEVLPFLAASRWLADAHLQALLQIGRLNTGCRGHVVEPIVPTAAAHRILDRLGKLGASRGESRNNLPRRPPKRLSHGPLPLLGDKEENGGGDLKLSVYIPVDCFHPSVQYSLPTRATTTTTTIMATSAPPES